VSKTHKLGLAFGLTVAICSSATAGDYRAEYDKKIKSAQVVGALGDEFGGESVNFYTGATTFSATDVTMPSNGLALSLGRRFAVEPDANVASVTTQLPNPIKETLSMRIKAFGDWDLDVPHISTVMSQGDGWIVNTNAPQNRCSVVGALPSASGGAVTGAPRCPMRLADYTFPRGSIGAAIRSIPPAATSLCCWHRCQTPSGRPPGAPTTGLQTKTGGSRVSHRLPILQAVRATWRSPRWDEVHVQLAHQAKRRFGASH
jgi:hypothetical protein